MKEEFTTIRIKKSTAIKLNMWRYSLDVETVDDVIDKILRVIPASELPNLKESKK